MNTKKRLHFSLTAQAIVSDFFHDLSPFFTGDIKRLFVSYLKAHNTNNILTYWQRSLINNFFEKKFFDNQSHLPEFKKGFHDVYQLQKEWIQVHNLLLNYYTTSGKKMNVLWGIDEKFIDLFFHNQSCPHFMKPFNVYQ
jgi:hypothetical protein